MAVLVIVWRHRSGISRLDQRLLVCCLPGVYAVAFAVLVDLSRSAISPGLVMRENYVTPALMLGLSLIFLTWKLTAARPQRLDGVAPSRLVAAAAAAPSGLDIAPGLNKPHFSGNWPG